MADVVRNEPAVEYEFWFYNTHDADWQNNEPVEKRVISVPAFSIGQPGTEQYNQLRENTLEFANDYVEQFGTNEQNASLIQPSSWFDNDEDLPALFCRHVAVRFVNTYEYIIDPDE